MWKKFTNHSYFISFRKADDDKYYKIYVTDYLNIWFGNFSERSFVDCLKESNPDLQLRDDILKDKGIQMLSNPDGLKRVEIKLDRSTMIIFISMAFPYTVNMNLKLIEGSKEMFFKEVTQPLLKMIQSLQSSDNELQLLLKKKDREIDEYKSEGIKVARHFKTPKFDEKAHKGKYNIFEENFGMSNIPNGLLEKSVSLPEENIILKREPPEVKLEPESSTVNIKIEPESSVLDTSSSTSTILTTNVKRELVKTESALNDIRRKRQAKLNL